VTLNLYIMDSIPRGDFVRSEPLRLAISGGAWTFCPSLGVFLYGRFGAGAADGLSAVAAVLLLATFWAIRLSDNPAIAPARRPPPNPLRSIGRFIAQPRLRLGWLIAFGRSSWWAQFFTFAPLYMVISGHSELMSALLISLGNATLLLTVLIGRLAERVGVRRVIVAAYLLAGPYQATAAHARPSTSPTAKSPDCQSANGRKSGTERAAARQATRRGSRRSAAFLPSSV
jgi:predicted MFS family arabinose efflux permease